MKFFNTLLLLSLLIHACSTTDKSKVMEQDVFIVSLEKDFDSKSNLILKDRSKAIHFSQDFWNYFIKARPVSGSLIFGPGFDGQKQDYLQLGDTSLAFSNLDRMGTIFFKKLLTNDAGDKEGEAFGNAFFVIPNDTTGQAEKEKQIEKRLKDYTLTDDVKEEYKKLSNILKGTDSSDHYIIIFKKDFVNRLYEIYK